MAKKPIAVFDISDTRDPARNEDWIKTAKNRASEAALHDKIARDHATQAESPGDSKTTAG